MRPLTKGEFAPTRSANNTPPLVTPVTIPRPAPGGDSAGTVAVSVPTGAAAFVPTGAADAMANAKSCTIALVWSVRALTLTR